MCAPWMGQARVLAHGVNETFFLAAAQASLTPDTLAPCPWVSSVLQTMACACACTAAAEGWQSRSPLVSHSQPRSGRCQSEHPSTWGQCRGTAGLCAATWDVGSEAPWPSQL